ncbi:MAG: glycosyltransferase family 4 protein [Verrucomicrobiota bacterium JB022]|nr:glycosyltransferase family 4 protein [Verrucomicrobiota bacterium JB022]
MRILLLSHYFYPEGNAPASRWYEFARRWVDAGHEVTVITGVPNVPDGVVYEGYRNKLCQSEMIDGIKVVRVWTYLAPNAGFAKRILNFLSYMVMAVCVGLFQKRPDRLIATSPQFFAGWAGTILSKLRRLPFILEIRDLWPESIAAVGAMKTDSGVYRFLEGLEKAMYRSADHIVTVGEGYAEKLRSKGVPDAKLTVIPNGADPEQFQPMARDSALEAQWNLQGKIVVSYVGTVGMASALDVVLQAAAKIQVTHPQVVFMIVGDGADRTRLEQLRTEKHLSNVILTGRVPKSDMPRYWSLSDVALVHLRDTDLFRTVLPSKLFEAMAMTCPILNGVAGDAARVVDEAQAGYNFQPESVDDLLANLMPLLDPQHRALLGLRGREFVQNTYNRQRFAGVYLDLLTTGAPHQWQPVRA